MKTAAAVVTGSRHLRAARNGQDAALTWTGRDAAALVVCDGCSSGTFSEVGARLGASLVARAIASRLEAGAPPHAIWDDVRCDVTATLGALVAQLPGPREDAVRDHFLFTIVATAATRDEVAVWAIGDGAYAIDRATRVLGPFADNAPPYLAYELLGERPAAHLEIAARWSSIVIATDGGAELELGELAMLTAHPDALRRRLAVLARTSERIAWDERRVVRTPALLQDDCAIAVLHREVAA